MAENVILDNKEWQKFIGNAVSKSNDFGRYLMAAANLFGFKDIIQHFSDESGPDGAWPERSEKTNRAYDIIGGSYRSSNKLLQLTGRLRGSFLPGSSFIQQEGKTAVRMFSDPTLVYARVHDEGSDTMPKREYMWLSDKAKELMLAMLLDQLTGEGGTV